MWKVTYNEMTKANNESLVYGRDYTCFVDCKLADIEKWVNKSCGKNTCDITKVEKIDIQYIDTRDQISSQETA